MAKFEVPDGWCVQAFRFTLDPTEEQARSLARHFGARRKAFNWTVAALKTDIQAWRETGAEAEKPSLRVLRKRWNTVKDNVCVNGETGAVWWPEAGIEQLDRDRATQPQIPPISHLGHPTAPEDPAQFVATVAKDPARRE